MPWQDWLLIAGFAVTSIELVLIAGIFFDDHAMRILAEKSLVLAERGVAAQEEYLALRRRWYESRAAKKEKKTEAQRVEENVIPQN